MDYPKLIVLNQKEESISIQRVNNTTIMYLQMEGLIKLGRPVITFGLRGMSSLFVTEVWTNHVHLHKRPEHT